MADLTGQVTFTPEEIAEFPQGPPGADGAPGSPGPPGPPGSGGGLPGRVYDVSKHGLIDDVGQGNTNNSPALQALIDSIPAASPGGYATFIYPFTKTGRYGFGDLGGGRGPNFAGKSIRNVGVGASVWLNGLNQSGIVPLADNLKVFNADGGSTLQHFGPSFENLLFGKNGKAGCTGLYLRNQNRVYLNRVVFVGLAKGIESDEGLGDCAFHDWFAIKFHQCETGWLGTGTNSLRIIGLDLFENVNYGLDLVAVNQLTASGIKINLASTGGTGIRSRGYASGFYGINGECYASSAAGTLVHFWGTPANQGDGNIVMVNSMHGQGGSNNRGLVFDTGTSGNKYLVGWASAFGAGKDIVDAGTSNRSL